MEEMDAITPINEAKAIKDRNYFRLLVLLMIFGLLAVIFVLNFQVAVVSGKSMEPTYHDRERLLITTAYWLFGPIQAGDIVVIRREGDLLIKRVAALPGEPIPDAGGFYAPYEQAVVPEKYIYVLGDNREHSEDSRSFGPVPIDQVIGKATIRREKPEGLLP